MSLTEIIFWLFARLRPLLWYYHRLARMLEVMLFCLEDAASLLYLADIPEARADFESKLADGEHVLDIIIALRAGEILGHPVLPQERPGIRSCARIHHASSLDRLAARLTRLVQRFEDVERLARLRASRLRRLRDAAPILLSADHRPQGTACGLLALASSSFFCFFPLAVFARAPSPAPAGLRIRAPP